MHHIFMLHIGMPCTITLLDYPCPIVTYFESSDVVSGVLVSSHFLQVCCESLHHSCLKHHCGMLQVGRSQWIASMSELGIMSSPSSERMALGCFSTLQYTSSWDVTIATPAKAVVGKARVEVTMCLDKDTTCITLSGL